MRAMHASTHSARRVAPGASATRPSTTRVGPRVARRSLEGFADLPSSEVSRIGVDDDFPTRLFAAAAPIDRALHPPPPPDTAESSKRRRTARHELSMDATSLNSALRDAVGAALPLAAIAGVTNELEVVYGPEDDGLRKAREKTRAPRFSFPPSHPLKRRARALSAARSFLRRGRAPVTLLARQGERARARARPRERGGAGGGAGGGRSQGATHH